MSFWFLFVGYVLGAKQVPFWLAGLIWVLSLGVREVWRARE